jgi:DNA-binding IclR family transcriptional regulator
VGKMGEKQDIETLRKEVTELRKTVYSLKNTIIELTNHIESSDTPFEGTQYSMFPDKSNCLDGDASWDRLVNLMQKEDRGLTATELAEKWGKSRSRTSEVLNKLAENGQIIKYRDGRMIRFRSAED